ncbi:MAG: ferritin [Pirellulaceae bacterium]
MLPQVVQDALSEQINMELCASYNYLAMSAYCKSQNFHGFGNWLAVQSQEEYGHSMKLYDFMMARNCQTDLREIPKPQAAFDSLLSVFEAALGQERKVSERIDALYELAFQEKAFAALVELQWFITEQVEEERTFTDVVAKLKMVGDDPSALIDLDREMGSRSAAESGGEAAG